MTDSEKTERLERKLLHAIAMEKRAQVERAIGETEVRRIVNRLSVAARNAEE